MTSKRKQFFLNGRKYTTYAYGGRWVAFQYDLRMGPPSEKIGKDFKTESAALIAVLKHSQKYIETIRTTTRAIK